MENLQINNIHDVRSFLYYLMVEMELGAGFHPDTPIYDYVRVNADHPGEEQLTFSPEFADVLQGQLIQCCRVCDKSNADIYLITMEMGRMLGYAPAPDLADMDPDDIDWEHYAYAFFQLPDKAAEYINRHRAGFPVPDPQGLDARNQIALAAALKKEIAIKARPTN